MQMNARRLTRESIRTRQKPSLVELEKVRTAAPGTRVLVYLEKDRWKPCTLVRARDMKVYVILPSGKVSTFSLNMVRPFLEIAVTNDTSSHRTQRKEKEHKKPVREPCQLLSRAKQGLYLGLESYLAVATDEFHKSRIKEINRLRELDCFQLVAACNDQEHGLLTGAPIVKPLSMRIFVALSRSYQLKLFTRDVTKAFVQFTSTLRRQFSCVHLVK